MAKAKALSLTKYERQVAGAIHEALSLLSGPTSIAGEPEEQVVLVLQDHLDRARARLNAVVKG